jgi:hypothetical protein
MLMVEVRMIGSHFLADLSAILSGAIAKKFTFDYEGRLWIAAAFDHEAAAFRIDFSGRVETVFRSRHILFDFVQPLPEGDLLLVRKRSIANAPNAAIVDGSGHLKREFSLGDWVSDIQTTPEAEIWVSYHDMRPDYPSPGLIKWDANGNQLAAYYRLAEQLPEILEVYALNVLNFGNLWFYYYADVHAEPFEIGDVPLIQLIDEQLTGYWRCPVFGARHIAVENDHVVFCGAFKAMNMLYLCRIRTDHELPIINTFRLHETDEVVAARAHRIAILNGTELSILLVDDLLHLNLSR